jgi:hypothetical protein
MARINSQKKGARYEREIAEILRGYGYEAKRGCQHAGGFDSPDVACEKFPCHIEAKFVQRLNIWDAFEQSANDAPPNKPASVIHRKNHKNFSLITLRLSDFLELIPKQ